MSVEANAPREALFVLRLVSSSLESPPQAAVQPSPESIRARPRLVRPKFHMESSRNPFGRRPNAGSRIHLTRPKGKNQPMPKKLRKALWRAMAATNEHRCEHSRSRQIPACCGAFFLSAFQLSAFASGYASFDFVRFSRVRYRSRRVQLYQIPLCPRSHAEMNQQAGGLLGGLNQDPPCITNDRQ